MENLTPADLNPPAVHKQRGHPKNKHIESQAATQELDFDKFWAVLNLSPQK